MEIRHAATIPALLSLNPLVNKYVTIRLARQVTKSSQVKDMTLTLFPIEKIQSHFSKKMTFRASLVTITVRDDERMAPRKREFYV